MQNLPATQNLDWPEILTGEILLLGLLSKLLYTLPEKEWLQSLIDEEVFAGEAPFAAQQPDVQRGLELLAGWAQGELSDADYLDLRSDETALFVGLPRTLAAPWESVYLNEERLVFQESTLHVRAWYRRFGLQAEKLHNEPDDHIALELSFMAHLANLGLQGLEEGAGLAEALTAQRDFLKEHLLLFGITWCSLVVKHAHTDFYRGLALCLRGALAELARLFELPFDAEPGK